MLSDQYRSFNRKIIAILVICLLSLIISFSTLLVSILIQKNESKSTASENISLQLSPIYTNDDKVYHDLSSNEFIIYKNKQTKEIALKGKIGLTLDRTDYSQIKTVKLDSNSYQVDYMPVSRAAQIKLHVQNTKLNTKLIDDGISCQSYEWSIQNDDYQTKRYAWQVFEDCFSLAGSYWYGGAEAYDQQFWPINNVSFPMTMPYLTGLFGKWSSVLERYWLNSQGIAIIVDQSVPLFVYKNQTSICLSADSSQPYNENITPALKYSICRSTDSGDPAFLNRLQVYVINNYFSKPSGIPDELMMKSPIWSTWANFKKRIDETKVRQFAQDILSNGFTHSQLEIDDKWQTEYGDFSFEKSKFPDIKGFVTELNGLGFRTTLWLHPFANIESKNFLYQSFQGYAVKAPDGLHPALTSWWDGLGCVILDTTNPNATDWFVQQLENLKLESRIDSFKFDAGEIEWLPKKFNLFNASITPDQYSIGYARMASRLGKMIEVRTGCQTQDLPIFVRMLDKDSRWDYVNGLKSVLTTALTMSILGYPFILPDMIGGNAYIFDGDNIDFDNPVIAYPDEQLYIRWAQLTAFLPAMQFSIPPWHYNQETNQICKKIVALHEDLVYPILLEEANNAVKLGTPIIRPVWWLDNQDKNLFTIDDQFLVGNEILVAPITDENTYSRDIYFPKGNWKAENGSVYKGPSLIENYPAPLDTIPYFIAV